MRLFLFTAIFMINFWENFSDESPCLINLLEISNQNVNKMKRDVDRTLSKISKSIEKTDANVKSYILTSKNGNDKERENLDDIEATAVGESLAKKKSIADCLEDDRVQMKMINSTEKIIYALCGDDFSLLLIRASLLSLKKISSQVNEVLPECLEIFPTSCEAQTQCLLNKFDALKKTLDDKKAKIETKLSRISDTSKICCDGKQNVIISLIKELEEKFKYCTSQIIG